MEKLQTEQFKNDKNKVIVCADIKQQLLIYTLESSDDNF